MSRFEAHHDVLWTGDTANLEEELRRQMSMRSWPHGWEDPQIRAKYGYLAPGDDNGVSAYLESVNGPCI